MNKSILVIDTPKSCSECELEESCPIYLNVLFKNKHKYNSQRHHNCPLQDTTELLEALENCKKDFYTSVVDTGFHKYTSQVKYREVKEPLYNKLYKALGGNVNE